MHNLVIVARLEEAEAPCFMKNASVSGSSKSQMLPSLLSLPASSKCFRFHILGLNIRKMSACYVILAETFHEVAVM